MQCCESRVLACLERERPVTLVLSGLPCLLLSVALPRLLGAGGQVLR